MRPINPHVRSMFARGFGPSPGGLVKSAPSRAGCGGMCPGAVPSSGLTSVRLPLDQWSRPSPQAPGASPESLCRRPYTAWDLLVVGTFWLCAPDAAGGARQPSPLEAASSLGLSPAAGARNAGWACGPPVPAAVQLAAARSPLRTGRHCFAETARSLQQVSAAFGQAGPRAGTAGPFARSAGYPAHAVNAPTRGRVRPQRATVGEQGRGRGSVVTVMPGEAPGDLSSQLFPPLSAERELAVLVLVEPRPDSPSARQALRPGCHPPCGRRSVRLPLPPHRVLHPQGHAAFQDIRFHRQLSVLPPQPRQLRPLVLILRTVTFANPDDGQPVTARGMCG